MKILYHLLISMYIAFITFTWISFFFGPDGYIETRKLIMYREKLVKSSSQMEIINRKLETEFRRLQNDPETITLEARSLGYFSENEGVFYLDGYNLENKGYSIGNLYKGFKKNHSSITALRYISIAAGIITFLFLTMFERKKGAYSVRQRFSEI